MALMQRIIDRTAQVGVIGLGYVGLPLVVALLKAGYRVVGVDISAAKVQALRAGDSYIPDVPSETLRPFVIGPDAPLTVATEYGALGVCDVVFICVPTPFDTHKTPDLSFIERAATSLASVLRADQLIILQSTTYPGTTDEIVKPILERTGLRAGEDFLLAFSPERVDPGNTTWTVENTPKVVGGLTARCAEAAVALLKALTPDVHVVSSPRVAEATKLLENVFRSVNIALVNELALLAERMGFDLWEVIRAASTKPFGFMPFYPGPGVGGHCIPVDPFYLAWKAREYDFSTRFIELAAETNNAMPHHVVGLIVRALGATGKGIYGANVLLLGVGFKADVTDTRNSPAERLVHLLVNLGARVRYHDPYVPEFAIEPSAIYPAPLVLRSAPLDDAIVRDQDCVVIVQKSRRVDLQRVLNTAAIVVDCVNATDGLQGAARVTRLGAAVAPSMPTGVLAHERV